MWLRSCCDKSHVVRAAFRQHDRSRCRLTTSSGSTLWEPLRFRPACTARCTDKLMLCPRLINCESTNSRTTAKRLMEYWRLCYIKICKFNVILLFLNYTITYNIMSFQIYFNIYLRIEDFFVCRWYYYIFKTIYAVLILETLVNIWLLYKKNP